MLEEQIGARLYTGPIYEKLNAVLRAQSGNPFLKKRCQEMTLGNTCAATPRNEDHHPTQNRVW